MQRRGGREISISISVQRRAGGREISISAYYILLLISTFISRTISVLISTFISRNMVCAGIVIPAPGRAARSRRIYISISFGAISRDVVCAGSVLPARGALAVCGSVSVLSCAGPRGPALSVLVCIHPHPPPDV